MEKDDGDGMFQGVRALVAEGVPDKAKLAQFICFYGGDTVDGLDVQDATHVIRTPAITVRIYWMGIGNGCFYGMALGD